MKIRFVLLASLYISKIFHVLKGSYSIFNTIYIQHVKYIKYLLKQIFNNFDL